MSRGDRFSKKGGGSSKQDEIGRTIHQRVDKLMLNRWKYLNPFDMFKDLTEEVYRYAMGADEWEAWQLLERNKKFRNAMSYTNRLFLAHPDADFNFSVTVPHATLISINIDWNALPPDVQEKIHNWVIRSESYRWEYTTIRDRVASLTRMCSTPGQIERVWPELMGFMPGHVLDTRLGKKVKSPYPEGVYEEGWQMVHPDKRTLKEIFRPERLEWFNDALAEALILPLQDWSKMPPFPEVTVLK